MRKDKTELYTLDSQGSLKFSTLFQLNQAKEKPESGWDHPVAAILIMAVCATLDFMMFKQLFGSFLEDYEIYQWLGTAGLLIGFDVAPVYMGIACSRYAQKIGRAKNGLIMALCGIAFFLAFTASLYLRSCTYQLVIPVSAENAVTSLMDKGVQLEEAVNPQAKPYAIFAGILPLVTSIVSFAISYLVSDPAKERMLRVHRERLALEDESRKLSSVLNIYENDRDYEVRLLEEDNAKLAAMEDRIREMSLYWADYVRERLKEHIGDPAATNELSKGSREGADPAAAEVTTEQDIFEERRGA